MAVHIAEVVEVTQFKCVSVQYLAFHFFWKNWEGLVDYVMIKRFSFLTSSLGKNLAR